MAENGQTSRPETNRVATKRGLPVYRVNPSIPPSNGLATRQKRFEVPGGKAAVIVDNGTGEIKGHETGTRRLCLNPPDVRRMFGSAINLATIQDTGC
jgi:hypothetical protein